MKSFKEKLNDRTATRVLYIIAAVVALTLVILAVAAVASQRRDGGRITTTTSIAPASDPVSGTKKPSTTEKPSTTNTDSGEPVTVIVDEPLEMVLPCAGYPGKTFDMLSLSYSLTMNDYRVHTGLDVTAEEGTPVFACADGTVKAIYADPLMGNSVEIEHRDGVVSIYRNLSPECAEGISEGVNVKGGDVIGKIGSSAMTEQAEEPHLHFELKVNGKNCDPLDYLEFTEETMSRGFEG